LKGFSKTDPLFDVNCACPSLFPKGTWNVNGQSASESLSSWLAMDEYPPDLYAIGFQELDLSKEAFLFHDSPKEPEWNNAVAKALHPASKYSPVKQIRLVGMMLIVFVREALVSFIHDVHAQTIGTGMDV
jgi:phosphatidylinositol-bisphosphatase